MDSCLTRYWQALRTRQSSINEIHVHESVLLAVKLLVQFIILLKLNVVVGACVAVHCQKGRVSPGTPGGSVCLIIILPCCDHRENGSKIAQRSLGGRLQSTTRGESTQSLRGEFNREKPITAKSVLQQEKGGGV